MRIIAFLFVIFGLPILISIAAGAFLLTLPENQYRIGSALLIGSVFPRSPEAGLGWLQSAADKNYRPAQSLVGTLLLEGSVVPQNRAEGIKLIQESAKHDDARAKLIEAMCYEFGQGVERNPVRALRIYEEVATGKAGDREKQQALLQAGGMWMSGRAPTYNFGKAHQMFVQLVGEGPSQPIVFYELGRMSEPGLLLSEVDRKNSGDLPRDSALAAKYYLRGARLGESNCQQLYAAACMGGVGTAQNTQDAIRWFKSAAEQRNYLSATNLGIIYACGIKVPRNSSEAKKWFALAEKSGFKSCSPLVDMVEKVPAKNVTQWVLDRAKSGDITALLVCGHIYDTGMGVPRDTKRAFDYFRRAAEAGNADAQVELAGFYEFGEPVPLDLHKAAEWFKKASDQGNAYAQNSLANYYFQELGGMPQSLPKAVVLYQKAAAQKDHNALWTLSILNIRGFIDKPDGALGLKLLQESANLGSMRAKEDLGDCWRSGVYWGVDAAKAQNWYETAAAQGDAEAMYDLGDMLWYQTRFNGKAVEWFTKAAECGHLQSQLKLAKAYSSGDKVTQDEAQAAKWYQAAAAQGSAAAAYQYKNLELQSLDPAYNRKDGDHVVYTKKAIKEGDVISKDLVEERVPEEPTVPEDAVPRKGLVIGKLARTDLSEGQLVTRSDLSLPDKDPAAAGDGANSSADD